MRPSALVAAGLVAGLGGCVRGGPSAARRAASPVVARVGGEDIRADEVAAVARLEHVTPRAALEQIVRDRLLAREAVRVGAANGRDRDDAAWRARVQLLLARLVEAPHTPETIPPSYFEALYQRRRVALHHDGLVHVVHAIAAGEADAGVDPAHVEAVRARAEALRERLLREPPGALTRERFETLARASPGLRVEDIPPFDRTGQSEDGNRFDPEFVRASWALTREAPLSATVITPFGAHVILRVGSAPPKPATPEEVRGAVFREGVNLQRARALAGLLERLRAAADVRVSEAAIASTGAPPRP